MSVAISLKSSIIAVLLETGDIVLLRKRNIGQGFLVDDHLRLNAKNTSNISFVDDSRFLQFTNKDNSLELIKINTNSYSPILDEKSI